MGHCAPRATAWLGLMMPLRGPGARLGAFLRLRFPRVNCKDGLNAPRARLECPPSSLSLG